MLNFPKFFVKFPKKCQFGKNLNFKLRNKISSFTCKTKFIYQSYRYHYNNHTNDIPHADCLIKQK